MRRPWIIALLLAAATLALYWPVRQFDLLYFDDPLLLNESPQVQAGLTWPSIQWAFTAVVIANWHPVTNLSFLLVSQFFGTAPGAHHLANAVIHAANAALLFALLWQLTGARWRSAIAAAVFAWHPLRVESVAWIAERKDVLCACFFLLALIFYVRSARFPRQDRTRQWFLGTSLVAFVLALLSKPMAVTLPCVLLLLDVWPLGRIDTSKWAWRPLRPVLAEKIPFFALTILFCVATYVIQHDYAAMTPWEKLGPARRVANAVSGYLAYPAQLIWPFHLAAIYPYPQSFDALQTGLKAALLLAISAGCVVQLKRRPWLAVGWFWYGVTALPVIGLVQVGEQAMADRYSYLPLIGPVVAIVWTAADWIRPRRVATISWAAITALILEGLIAVSARQLHFWENTVALFAHNLEVTPNNGSAEFTLGLGFEHRGDTNRAVVCYRAAKIMAPGDLQNRRSLVALLAKGGHFDAAETECRALLELEPSACTDQLVLSALAASQGRTNEAFALLSETVQLNPDCVEALNNLAWELATSPSPEIRNGPRAVALAQHACELTQFKQTLYVGTLAAAQAAAGKFDEAVASARRACALAAKNGETDLGQRNQELLELYRQHRVAHD